MTGITKVLCVLAFIAVAMMQPAGHWYCTITKNLCSMDQAESCFSLNTDCCESHSEQEQEQEQEKPCCVEMGGEWEIVPASALVSLPEPSLLDCFAWGTVKLLNLPIQENTAEWNYGGIDPPPGSTDAFALSCVRLI